MMRTPVTDVLPARVRRELTKLGNDLRDARRRRGLTVAMMVERVGVSKATYLKVEKGDPTVSMGAYAMSLFALGLSGALAGIADSGSDQTGLLLDSKRLPQRVRTKPGLKAL